LPAIVANVAGRENAGKMPALRLQSRLSLSYPLPFSFGNRQYSSALGTERTFFG
jgi:hypothetical protein